MVYAGTSSSFTWFMKQKKFLIKFKDIGNVNWITTRLKCFKVPLREQRKLKIIIIPQKKRNY